MMPRTSIANHLEQQSAWQMITIMLLRQAGYQLAPLPTIYASHEQMHIHVFTQQACTNTVGPQKRGGDLLCMVPSQGWPFRPIYELLHTCTTTCTNYCAWANQFNCSAYIQFHYFSGLILIEPRGHPQLYKLYRKRTSVFRPLSIISTKVMCIPEWLVRTTGDL